MATKSGGGEAVTLAEAKEIVRPEPQFNLQSMLEASKDLAVALVKYRIGSQVLPAEQAQVEGCEEHARKIVDEIRAMIEARKNTAALGGEA